MRFGKIPTRIMLISATAKTFHCGWEDIDVSLAEDVNVVPCFAADAESADHIAQGRKWAQDTNIGQRLSNISPIEETFDNKPFALTLVGLEKRQEGGRSFKVIDDNKRLFDLREDVLLETLLSVGTTVGGRLNGGFIFARVGTQMRLIRVDSSLHAEMLKSEKRRQSQNVAADELVAGGVYANRRGLVIYLGRVNTIDDTTGRSVKGEHLSIALSKLDQKDPARAYQNALINASSASVFQLGKSITTVELMSRISVPDDLIEHIRKHALTHVERYMYSLSDARALEAWGLEEVKAMNRRKLKAASTILNLLPHEQGIALSVEYQALLERYSSAA
jgi:hypothetical protein